MKNLPTIFILILCVSFVSNNSFAQPSITWDSVIEVSTNEFGNKCSRIVLNSSGDPMVLHGKSGNNAGLYLSIWEGGSFGTPIQVTPETNIYLSESEGPRIAVSGDRVAVSYQISGQWDTGAYVVMSEDSGLTWGTPYPLAANTTDDHFMPYIAFDGNSQPWAALKWKTAPTFEGVHLFNPDTDSFEPALNAGIATAGVPVCECCPSNPFYYDGVFYDVVRNNNNNTRDFWLLKSPDGVNWDEAIDIDPADWFISSCPASGASSAILSDGTLVSAFMNAPDGSRVYWSSVDLSNFTFTESARIDPLNNSTENHPSLSASGDWLVAAWERNSSGYDVMISVSDIGPEALSNTIFNVTEDLSGHNRNPSVVYDGEFIHLAYKNTSSGVSHYLRGVISGTSKIESLGEENELWTLTTTHSEWRINSTLGSNSTFTLFDLNGRVLNSGEFVGELHLEKRSGSYLLKLETGGVISTLKLF